MLQKGSFHNLIYACMSLICWYGYVFERFSPWTWRLKLLKGFTFALHIRANFSHTSVKLNILSLIKPSVCFFWIILIYGKMLPFFRTLDLMRRSWRECLVYRALTEQMYTWSQDMVEESESILYLLSSIIHAGDN